MSISGSIEGWEEESRSDKFADIRCGIIGNKKIIRTPYGRMNMLYADWCASGRLYEPIEAYMVQNIGPLVGNTHTDSNATGASMTHAYHAALEVVKRHVHAGPCDIVLSCGTGMTAAVNKLQRLLNLRVPEGLQGRLLLHEEERPVIFITHMEHHSNHISWLETIGEVVVLPPDANGQVSPIMLDHLLVQFRHRPLKIGAFTACSNVTGIRTPLHELAAVMHEHGGLAFADYSASAPYDNIDMHPQGQGRHLDGIYFSPHKFLGGPGTSGILVMDSRLITCRVPDQPGGGTVIWTDPWGRREYVGSVEEREDGGTPGFLQAVRSALAIKLKEEMGTQAIWQREQALLSELWPYLDAHPRIGILESRNRDRHSIVSFTVEGLHYRLVTRMLNDRFGIQARGGCSCAGSYGHYLFGIGPDVSDHIYGQIHAGYLENKPGWVRISLHPSMDAADVREIGAAVLQIALYGDEWARDYEFQADNGEVRHKSGVKASMLPDGEGGLEDSWGLLFKQPLQHVQSEDVHGGIVKFNPPLIPHVAKLS